MNTGVTSYLFYSNYFAKSRIKFANSTADLTPILSKTLAPDQSVRRQFFRRPNFYNLAAAVKA